MVRYRKFSLIVGTVLCAIVLLAVAIGMFYTPYDPDAMNQAAKHLAPSATHWFGTDNFGRDILSRVMKGAGTTFFVGLCVIAIGGSIGTVVGALTGYFGGVIDEVIMRVNDALLAFPSVLLALVFVSIFGANEKNVILALGILFIPSFARIVRSEVIAQKELDYVKNAALMGAGRLRTVFVHILPNTFPVLASALAIGFNNAVLAEAGLSYLGLGVQPPQASLGRMLSEAQSSLLSAPWYALFPGLTIVAAALGVSLLSEAVTGEDGIRRKRRYGRRTTQEISKDGEESPQIKETESCEAGNRQEPLLRVEELSIRFGETVAVKKISFAVAAGEAVGIVGESGSGKSVTSHAILGVLAGNGEICGGRIVYDGTALEELSEEAYRALRGGEIAMIFQEPMTSLNPVVTIETQMREMLRLHLPETSKKEERRRLIDALLEVELDAPETLLRCYPHELSGGMRQRVMIAMALLCKPRLLIADEPTTALDAEVQEQVLALLQRLTRKYEMALLFISHDLRVVRRLCGRVLVMNEGTVVEQGPCEDIFEHPQEAYTKRLLAAAKGERFVEHMQFPETKETILQAEHLHVFYDTGRQRLRRLFGGGRALAARKEVLNDVSFTLYRGDVCGLAGRSGSGKTTLAKCLLGLLRPQVGRVVCDGKIGMVFQDPYGSLNPAKTVGWLLEEPLRNRGVAKAERKKEAGKMLAAIGLSDAYANRRIRALSGGQRQRVAIGIAMMARPEILILDEPVSALDVTVQEQILALLAEFHDHYALTYLLISHDPRVLARMTNRLVQTSGFAATQTKEGKETA